MSDAKRYLLLEVRDTEGRMQSDVRKIRAALHNLYEAEGMDVGEVMFLDANSPWQRRDEYAEVARLFAATMGRARRLMETAAHLPWSRIKR